jgi:hypothetical protein
MMLQTFLYRPTSPQPASSSHLHVADYVPHNYMTNAFVTSDENYCGGCCDVTLYLRSAATPDVDAWDTGHTTPCNGIGDSDRDGILL